MKQVNGRRRFVGYSLTATALTAGGWWALRDPDPVFRFSGPHPPRSHAFVQPPRLALVLGGGGPRGFAHVGVLKALHRARIRPDVIVGSSMGAVVGVLYAADPDADRLEAAALEFDPGRWWRDLTGRRHPWLRGDALAASLADRLQGRTLESLPIAAGTVATDQETGAAVAFTRGDCVTAIRASASIPGVFKPVEIEGRTYLDGDLAAPVPVRLARALGATNVVAVDVMCHPAEMVADLRESPEWMISDYYRHALNLRDLPFADVVISPRLGLYASYSNEQRRRFIEIGEAAADAALVAIQRRLHETTPQIDTKKPT